LIYKIIYLITSGVDRPKLVLKLQLHQNPGRTLIGNPVKASRYADQELHGSGEIDIAFSAQSEPLHQVA